VVHGDREDDDVIARAVGSGVDALVDVIPYVPRHARQLVDPAGRVGAVVAISSASVYADIRGHPLLVGFEEPYPPPRPPEIPETHPTVAAGDADYASRKRAMEEVLLGQDAVPVTVLRPGAIYGPGDIASREWFFVKRALDRRRFVVLAAHGRSRFHQTAAENLAELNWLAVQRPATRVVNAGNEKVRSVLETSRSVARAMDHAWEEVLLEGAPIEGVGDTPWTVPEEHPFVLDITLAREELGYRDAISYDQSIATTARWLTSVADRWEEAIPRARELYGPMLDNYADEDRVVAALRSRDATT
jgi:nucleoside-diphosphate-sugar epimerase